jgi:hypothetical protein
MAGTFGRRLKHALVLMICSISRVFEILQCFAKPAVLLDYSLEVR